MCVCMNVCHRSIYLSHPAHITHTHTPFDEWYRDGFSFSLSPVGLSLPKCFRVTVLTIIYIITLAVENKFQTTKKKIYSKTIKINGNNRRGKKIAFKWSAAMKYDKCMPLVGQFYSIFNMSMASNQCSRR